MTKCARLVVRGLSLAVSMPGRFIPPLLPLLSLGVVLLALGALLLAADWWFCMPEGQTARYVGRQECARCHQKEIELWADSDHDRAMDLATPDTVLGNFGDQEFPHVAFEYIPRLSKSDLQTVAKRTEPAQWAVAFHDVQEQLKKRIFSRMPEQLTAQVTEEMENLVTVRPCDVIRAQDEIAHAVGCLENAGEISIDFGVTSRMFRRGGKFFIETDDPKGKMETFQIKYTFGVRPLQQYLVEFPDGRVQCLPITWNTEQKRWFHLYPGEAIPAGDELHWTGPLQNWNYMCAECHSTNLEKKHDLKRNTYHTTWSEIDVSCETCHGPGSLHVELADSYGVFWDRRIGYGLPRLKDENSRVEIETCAPCHSRRRAVYPDERAGKKLRDHYPLLDYYMPELFDGNLYYPDGQILEEDYVYGSFIQSKMYDQGVRCTDCHDPHALRVKYAGRDAPWGTIPDNRLCTGCHTNQHPAGTYDTAAHHHHPDSSQPGTKCVECHMPETTYMVADPRRDHSIRNPRPDLTVSLGIPNACNGCHNDKSKGETPEWAEQQVQKWYGKRKGPRHFAYAIAAGRDGKPEGELALDAVIRRKDAGAALRATAILLLARYPGATGQFAAFRGLKDREALVRAAAVRSLQYLSVEQLQPRLAPLLHDPVRAVRTEAARVISRVPRHQLSPRDLEAFDAALAEYLTGQENVGDQAAAHLNIAVIYTNLGKLDKAEQEYQTALRLDPSFVPARINLAMLYDQQGEKAEAADEFRKVIELEPKLAEAHYSLGLLLAEDEARLEEAAESLATAAQLAPENPRIHYNYGLALQRLGKADEAEESLKTAYKLAPRMPDYLHALTILYTQQNRWARALKCAEELVRRQPNNQQMQALLEYVKRESEKNDE